jgi:predicted small integral membrane protein
LKIVKPEARPPVFSPCGPYKRDPAVLWKLIVFGVPVFIAFAASALAFAREKTLIALVQLIGAVCLVVVLFTHISEAFGLFPSMGWGRPNSLGHYIDLVSAITGVILLTVGYFSRLFLRKKLFH